ncbi:hypothetical protein ABDB81_18615 [Cupriavidus sp. DL-D2]
MSSHSSSHRVEREARVIGTAPRKAKVWSGAATGRDDRWLARTGWPIARTTPPTLQPPADSPRVQLDAQWDGGTKLYCVLRVASGHQEAV